jgi:hypothetical protein
VLWQAANVFCPGSKNLSPGNEDDQAKGNRFVIQRKTEANIHIHRYSREQSNP